MGKNKVSSFFQVMFAVLFLALVIFAVATVVFCMIGVFIYGFTFLTSLVGFSIPVVFEVLAIISIVCGIVFTVVFVVKK